MDTLEKQSRRNASIDAPALCEEIWLLGQPTLQRYLDFVDERVIDGASLDRRALTDEWRAANDYYDELATREAGIANTAQCLELDATLKPLLEEVMADARYRNTYDALPTRFGLVELDKLVVFQHHVTHNFIESLKTRLGPKPDAAILFRFCLPLAEPEAPVQIKRVGSKRYAFHSRSTDFRFHKPVLLRPEQISGLDTYGTIAGVVGLVVGFGSNFINVIEGEHRLLLHNGYHRACALRALGITHAPCIIQSITRLDELEITANHRIVEDYARYFGAPRPPLLKDFFDARLRKVLPTHKVERIIEVNFEVRDYLVQQ